MFRAWVFSVVLPSLTVTFSRLGLTCLKSSSTCNTVIKCKYSRKWPKNSIHEFDDLAKGKISQGNFTRTETAPDLSSFLTTLDIFFHHYLWVCNWNIYSTMANCTSYPNDFSTVIELTTVSETISLSPVKVSDSVHVTLTTRHRAAHFFLEFDSQAYKGHV